MQEESLASNVLTLSSQSNLNNQKGLQYEKEFRITFADTNAEGNVSHYEYAKYFGIVRELFAMDLVPNFMEDAGHKYLLKTCSASYEYKRDFFFGDTMLVCLRVNGVTASGLTLEADFINPKTGVIHASGVQEIVYTDLKGIPRRIPGELMSLLRTIA
ncbi:MAG: acyl-CoA thioesterase [Syntrophaceae bacterium]|nr:acyl-CoA thioesterase [Syntrophaceae bacterium]